MYAVQKCYLCVKTEGDTYMVAKRIAELRKKAGMNQAQLAKQLKLSASAVSMYEQGQRYPDIDKLIVLAKVFDVSLDYLITGSEYPCSIGSPPEARKPENCPCTTCYWKNYRDK